MVPLQARLDARSTRPADGQGSDTGIEIETIPGIIYDSQLMGFHWHAAWRIKADNARYETGVAEYQMRRRRLEELCR